MNNSGSLSISVYQDPLSALPVHSASFCPGEGDDAVFM